MSKHVERKQYAATAVRVTEACAAAAAELGWHADSKKPLCWKEELAGKRLFSMRGAFGNRATMQVAVTGAAEGSDAVYTCSNFGFGPVQTGYVRNRAEVFMTAVEQRLGN
jgi:hypothetical protein